MSDCCSVEGCEKRPTGRGWCPGHYARWRKYGDVKADIPIFKKSGPCRVEGCGGRPIGRELCESHYGHWRRTGEVGREVDRLRATIERVRRALEEPTT